MLIKGIAAGVDAISKIFGIGNTIYSNHKEEERYTNEQDYNRALQQQIFDREDTAYQRAVADAQMAGLSPVVAAGSGGAGTGTVVSAPNKNPAQQISPTQLFSLVRGIQELELAEDANERAWAETNAKIAFDADTLDLARNQAMLDFNLRTSEIFNQAQRWSWEQQQREKEFNAEQKWIDRKFKVDVSELNWQMEQAVKDFERQGVWQQDKHDLERMDTIWRNINGSVNAGSSFLNSILPGGLVKSLGEQVSKMIKGSMKKNNAPQGKYSPDGGYYYSPEDLGY